MRASGCESAWPHLTLATILSRGRPEIGGRYTILTLDFADIAHKREPKRGPNALKTLGART